MKQKRIVILGSTGSIGTQTLAVVDAFPDRYSVIGLTCGKNMTVFKEQLHKYRPQYACVQNPSDYEILKKEFSDITFLCGKEGLNEIASLAAIDLLIVAIVGTASLEPTHRAIETGTPIGLACKEVLVSAGDMIMSKAKEKGVPILPIDSEHAALKQCLAGVNEDKASISKLILTASGGPFWTKPLADFSDITPELALKHPNWDMGAKITIDSATLMNKGLEIIEAHHLFQVPYSQLEAVIHPQSIIHSIVEFTDGTQLAQMGLPDMRFPIQYVLDYPNKNENPWPKTKLTELAPLEFHPIETQKFPLFQRTLEVGEKGGNAPAILNAANEVAVGLFLKKEIGFTDIIRVIDGALDRYAFDDNPSIEDIIQLDQEIKSQLLVESVGLG
ncbi:1-deoxy-D-xylulose-5-phosphate reductoisomerase [Candidatus Marinamargulisbacteria bacterium SCGC AG-439-L15]|nr:1-deoxy-D-xylulose-5-phosphate reductoisomerase [Candidatus Marinamargulisbacteria bacterium SCGC AG-439-L15]